MSEDHWSVTVCRNGEEIVTIESNCLSGREISAEDAEAIRNAGRHLLAFVGDELMAENAALAALLPSASRGFARLRAFVDPAVPRGQKKDAGREPL